MSTVAPEFWLDERRLAWWPQGDVRATRVRSVGPRSSSTAAAARARGHRRLLVWSLAALALVAAAVALPVSLSTSDPARPVRAPAPVRREAGVGRLLDRIATCESHDDPAAVSPAGLYRGEYQFDFSTWYSVGGRGDPASASTAAQERRATTLLDDRGISPWPVCGPAALVAVAPQLHARLSSLR